MSEKKVVEVVENILSKNDCEAARVRSHLDLHKILSVNLMSGPGSGKTTLLEQTILKSGLKIGVVEGDLETNLDADRIIKAGAYAHQISTGQTCHLDAFMVREGLAKLPLDDIEVIFVENVGNLVCPASYDVGSHLNVVLLSVPEGSDKVAKYPVMFRAADVVVFTKIGLLEHFEFDLELAKSEAKKLNPSVQFFEIDSKNGTGVEQWCEFIRAQSALRKG